MGGYLVIFRGVWVWTGRNQRGIKRNKEERGEEEFLPKE